MLSASEQDRVSEGEERGWIQLQREQDREGDVDRVKKEREREREEYADVD